MDKKELFRAIDTCEDTFIKETAEDIQKRKPSMIRRFFFVNSSENTEKDMRKLSGVRVAVAIVICVIVLSIGVQTAARVSTVFRDWIEQTFQIKSSSDNQKGKNGRSNEEETGRVRRRNNKAGFSGSYKRNTFSFQYSIIGQEIFGYNYSENLVQVFDQINKQGEVYFSVENAKGNEQILCVNLKSGECRQVVKPGDGMNMSMSPDGKYILINHSKSYWTVFNTENETERKVEGLSGYALSNEYDFINSDHIAAVGDAFTKNNTEFYRLNYIDLETGKVKVYPEYGDIKGCWTYQCDTKKKQLEIENLITKQKKVIPLKQAEDVHIMQINGDYVLLGTDSGDVYYLYNLQDETYRALDIPEEIRGTLEMYIVKKEKKLLLTNEKEAYLVNLK